MTITKLLIELALQLTVAIGERVKETIGETLIKVPGADASPRDIAIATKSAVSADREGKIASERAKRFTCAYCGRILKDNERDGLGHCNSCTNTIRRLGDYGPGGE